jgi:probable ATP-dependent RNA helicase DDX4
MNVYVPPHLKDAKKSLKEPLELQKVSIDDTKITTNSPYETLDSFKSLRCSKNLTFENPTIIQKIAIPILLNNHPLQCRAPTGMGKTMRFLLPLIENIKYAQGLKICIISPTRELCNQIKEEAMRITKALKIERNQLSIYLPTRE